MRFAIIATLSASLALAGCASAPPVRTPEIALPARFDAAAAGDATAIPDRWWHLYGDEQLSALVDRALTRGFDVRIAMTRLQEARAVRRAALSRFRIQGELQASGEMRRTDNLSVGDFSLPGLPDDVSLDGFFAPTTTRSASATLPVSWELDLFGRRGATKRAAEADYAAARFQYEGTRAALAADVGRTLFEARGLAAQLGDAQAAETIQRQLADIVGQRAARGLAATSEVDRVAADLAQAEAQAADIAATLEASKRALLILIGDGADPRATLPIAAATPPLPGTPATLPGDLLVRRPDLREAEARLRSATGGVRLAELAFYPTINLQAALGIAAQTGGIVTTTASQSIGGGITAPIFDRARLNAELRGASARAEQAVLTYERTVQTAYGEVDQALVRLAADRRRVATLNEGALRADRAYAAALQRYTRGLSGLQEALDAERAMRATRTAQTAARIEALQRTVQLFQALGGGWDPAEVSQGQP